MPPSTRPPRSAAVLLLAAAAAAPGCAPSPPLHTVTGKVVFADGTPFAGATVCFDPVDPAASPAGAGGTTRADGTFTLRSNGLGPGAYAGRYRAYLLMTDTGDHNPNRPRKLPVDRRFTDARTSGLEFAVGPGVNDFTLTVTRPAR